MEKKTDLNFELLWKAEDKLKEGRELNNEEIKEVLKLIRYTQGDYYPTREEYEDFLKDLEKLSKINFEKNPNTYIKIVDKCSIFESKYY